MTLSPYLASGRWLVWGLALAALLGMRADVARAQARDSVPSARYFNAFGPFYDGSYEDALEIYRDESRSAIKTAQSQWIDSICYYTMTGECYYQMGRLGEALDRYNAALRLYVAFYDWMIRVQFPPTIQPVASRPNIPWGASRRGAKFGQYPESMLMGQGRINNNDIIRGGGVVQNPLLMPVHVSEIVRATSLAMRRRRELLGPVCKHDQLTRELASVLARRPGPVNHWSEAWVNLQLGIAQAAAGNSTQAIATLKNAIVVSGEYDHPLTSVALLELGRLALEAGDTATAARLFEEATYAAAAYPDPGVLEEAFRYGQMTHLMTNGQGVYPPLVAAMQWAKSRNYRQLYTSLNLLLAENLAVLGQTQQAAARLSDARGSMARSNMLAGVLGARLNHLNAVVSYQAGNVSAGDQAIAAALAFQTQKPAGSLWLFHLGLVERSYLQGITERNAIALFESVLRDPTAADWASSPLECLSILTTPHSAAIEHWFEVALKRQEHERAVEIADRARRHRFFSTLSLGGRLLALRWLLDGPAELLNDQATLEKQDLLVRYPQYAQLAQQIERIRGELARLPRVPDDADGKRKQGERLEEMARLYQTQDVILRQIAVRREPAEMVFPPLRNTRVLQQKMPAGHVLLTFFTAGGQTHAFMFSREKYLTWRLGSSAQLQKQLSTLLRELGNYNQNHEIGQTELTQAAWKRTAGKVKDLLFEKSKVDLDLKFEELIVVPDGALWYLPFEALPIGKDNAVRPLISKVRVRYAPTVGLAMPYSTERAARPNTAVVVGKLFPRDADTVAQAQFERLSRVVPGAVAVPHTLPAASNVYRGLYEGLIVLDDVEPSDGPYDWSPFQVDRNKPASSLASWLPLPYGPREIILPGFHTAAETALGKRSKGGDLFLTVCGLMSTGARTVLISRWRTGGQTSYDLVREFVQELPHTSPADAWQRSVQLVSSMQLDPLVEPRLKKFPVDAEIPKAEHPFFWAGYLLVDSGRLPPAADAEEPGALEEPAAAAKGEAIEPIEKLPVEKQPAEKAEGAAQQGNFVLPPIDVADQRGEVAPAGKDEAPPPAKEKNPKPKPRPRIPQAR